MRESIRNQLPLLLEKFQYVGLYCTISGSAERRIQMNRCAAMQPVINRSIPRPISHIPHAVGAFGTSGMKDLAYFRRESLSTD